MASPVCRTSKATSQSDSASSATRSAFFHVDIAEVQTAEGKLYLFVGIDRTSKFAVTHLFYKADRRTAWEFVEHLLKAVPYRIRAILADNPVLSEIEGGIHFAEQPRNRNTAARVKCGAT